MVDGGAEGAGASFAFRSASVDVLHARVRHEARDGEGDLGEDLGAVRDDDAAADLGGAADGGLHGGVVAAADDDVVRVVGDGGGDGAAGEAEAAREGDADVAGAAVALDDGELGEVARRVRDGGAVDDAGLGGRRAGGERAGVDLDDADVRAGSGGEAQARGVEAVEAERGPLGDAARGDVDEELPALRDALPAEDDEVGPDVLERGEGDEVGAEAGGDRLRGRGSRSAARTTTTRGGTRGPGRGPSRWRGGRGGRRGRG